ncbi:MAG: M48 family metalloprotease [Candidatus Kariarchaeaceae archaeon]
MPFRLAIRGFAAIFTLFSMVAGLLGAVFYIVSSYTNALVGMGTVTFLMIPIVIALIFVLLQWMISPYIMDWTIGWVYKSTRWGAIDEVLDANIAKFVHSLEQKYRFTFGKIRIIDDLNPTAFTYGHNKTGARLVLSKGIFHFLAEDEVKAVIAHEAGHVVHRDFIYMTLVGIFPIFFYTVYRGISRSGRTLTAVVASGKDKDAAKSAATMAVAMFITAVIAYIMYWISHLLVLLISRVREFYADDFSARATDNPNALSTALIKIAYGMAIAESEEKKEDEASQKDGTSLSKSTPSAKKGRSQESDTQWRRGFKDATRSFNIFDGKSANDLAFSAAGRGYSVEADAVAEAAMWDLSNPWGGFLELKSTHPLPAKRILQLNETAEELGLVPAYPKVGQVRPPESLWDEFFVDIFLEYVTFWLLIIFPLIGGVVFAMYDLNFYVGAGVGLLAASFFWWLRVKMKYPKVGFDFTPRRSISDTIRQEYEASPVRGKAAHFEGQIVGRGTPGYYFSEDLVLQDESGIITLDYENPLGINIFYSLFKVPRTIGQKARVVGWFKRTPRPVLVIHKMEVNNVGDTRTYWRFTRYFVLWFIIGAAFALIAYGYGII